MVAAIRRGTSFRRVAQLFRVAVATVQFWVRRAGQQRLDRVDWANLFTSCPVALRLTPGTSW